MKQISDILREAADVYLWPGSYPYGRDHERFSCCAVDNVDCPQRDKLKVYKFLRSLGLNTESLSQFDDIHFFDSEARQGARFLWLHFAALVAEDEGL